MVNNDLGAIKVKTERQNKKNPIKIGVRVGIEPGTSRTAVLQATEPSK